MATKTVQLPVLTCTRCGYEWVQRYYARKPRVCANKKCKSPYWNVGYKEKMPLNVGYEAKKRQK